MASEMSEENAFLQDQVHRLSVSLSHYQTNKHSPSGVPVHDGVLRHLGSKSLQLDDKRLLSPLLAEYDLTVAELNQQILTYQSEIESMASRIDQVTAENTRLHRELRKSLEVRIDQATQSSSAGGKRNSDGWGSDGNMKNVMGTLQQQLEMVTEDRDNYRDLLRKTTNELEVMQKSDQEKTKKILANKAELVGFQQTAITAKQVAEELEYSCVKLDEERLRCLKTVQAQEVELSHLQENLSQAKAELKTTADKNTEMKKSLDELAFQLKKRESEKVRTMDTEHSLDDKLHVMHITNTDLEGKLLATQRELATLSGDKTDLEETLSAMQTRVSTLEQREYEAVCHVKESMQIAESALLEKEQVSIREQQLGKEVERLKTTVATILKEAGERTRNEVDILRVECNQSIDKMGVEIHRLEQECAERQVQLERSQREKKMVEKELEKTLAQKPLDVAQTGDNIHELQKRVCVAERARDDAQVKLEGVTVKNKMLEAKVLDEKQANEQLTDEHRKWQKQVQEDSQNLREQRMKALSQIDNLKQKLRVSEGAKEAAEVKLVQELATLEHKLEVREKDMSYRLESCEGSHRKSIHELRNLLTAQHRVGAKWREESKSMAQKFEQTISELKAELIRYKSRSDELTKQLNHMKHIKDNMSKQLKDVTSSNSSLQQKLKEAEAQGEMAMEQMAELASREKLLLQERRELHRQLDKVKLLMSRNERSSSSHLHSALYKLPPGPTTHHHNPAFLPDSTPPSLSHHPPPPPGSNTWNHTLSQLKQSIQQVREDLGGQYSGAEGVHLNDDDNDTMSEHSALSRRDLSRSTHFVS